MTDTGTIPLQMLRSIAESLIEATSPNPPGDTDEVARRAISFLEEEGIPFRIHTPAPNKVNIVADVHGQHPGLHVVMNAHLDVFPDSPTLGHIQTSSDQDDSADPQEVWIYGRGAVDMKGGAAAFLMVMRALHSMRSELHGRASLLLVCDEETFGPYGSLAVLEQWPEYKGDVLLSSEPSSTSAIRWGERGFLWLDGHFSMNSGGHGAFPTTEPSAIEKAARFINALHDRYPKSAPVFDQTTNPPRFIPERADAAARNVSVNCGVVSGGTKLNMQAQTCDVEVDIRLPSDRTVSDMLTEVQELARSHGGEVQVRNSSEPNQSDTDHPVFAIMTTAVQRNTGETPLISLGMPCTDTRVWRRHGVPAAVFGPSPLTMATANERVTLHELSIVASVHLETTLALLSENVSQPPDSHTN